MNARTKKLHIVPVFCEGLYPSVRVLKDVYYEDEQYQPNYKKLFSN